MKITHRQLKQLIKEEVKLILEIKDEEDMGELLSLIGLSDIYIKAKVPKIRKEIREALALWHSRISNHEKTLDALGGDVDAYDMLTNEEFRRVFEHLYKTL